MRFTGLWQKSIYISETYSAWAGSSEHDSVIGRGCRALLLEGLRGLLSERDSVLAYTNSPENPLIGPRLSVVRRDPLEWENAAASGLPIAPFEGPSPVEALRLV